MSLPAAVAGLFIVRVGQSIIDLLLSPQPTADDDLDTVFPDRPKPIDPNFNPPNPQGDYPNYPHNSPVCYEPPRNIYREPDRDGNEPPQLPPRRLPAEGDDQKAVDTPLGQVFSLSEWIQDRKFGQLLWNPLNEKPLKIRQGFSRDADQEFKIAVENGFEKYKRWLGAQIDLEYAKSDEYLKDYNFWDGTAWVMPQHLGGCQGDLSINFGTEALQKWGAVYKIQSKNCLYGVVDAIPNGYEVTNANLPNTEQLSDNLKELEFLGNQALLKLVGGSNFPVSVPKDLTGLPTFEEFKNEGVDDRQLDQEFFDKEDNKTFSIEDLQEKAEELEKQLGEDYKKKHYVRINNLFEFISWQSQQMDALLGAYPIEIEIPDSDLTKEGNQKQKITLPNIAETLAELMGNSLMQRTYTDALLDVGLRALQETVSTKAMGVSSHAAIESIVDYLGYKIEKKEKKVDFVVNPKLEIKDDKDFDLSQYLENTQVGVAVEEFDDESTLERKLIALLEAAAIIKAKSARTVNLEDLKGIKDLFKDSLDIFTGKKDPEEKSDFEQFLEDVERGFTNKPGIKDPERPWGRNYDQRPKIRDLSNNGDS